MGNPYLKLHLSILIAGFTGILGKLIQLPEGPLVWWRLLLTSIIFVSYLGLRARMPRVSLRDVPGLCGVGALIAVHWLFFYGSIKYANVSIAVVCFALTGFFTAVFEPIFKKRLPLLRELFFSLITVLGIALIFHFDTQFRTGIVLGIFSAAFAALFTLAVKRVGKSHESNTILLFQMIGGFGFITLAAPVYLSFFPGAMLVPEVTDFAFLLILSSVCTIGLFLFEIQALRQIPAFTVNLSFNLEPIYSILLAMLIFGEANELGWSFLIGLGLICFSVILQTIYTMRQTAGVR